MIFIFDLIKALFRSTFLTEYFLEKNLQAYASRLNGELLDVGCGQKPYQKFFPHIKKYVGLDQANTPTKSQNVDVFGDALDLPFPNDSFDSVLSTQTLEHVKDPQKMILEVARVLKKEGRVLLTAPLTWEIHDEPNDYFRFTPFGLSELFEKAGLKVLEIKPLGGLWAAAGQTYLNAMHHTFGNIPILKYFFKFIYFGENLSFFLFDQIFKSSKNAPDFLVLAQKP